MTSRPPPSAHSSGPPGSLPPGTTVQVGEYLVTVEKFLSEGGFAHVYRVRSSVPIFGTNLHVLKRVAVPDKAALKEVRKEVDVMKQLRNHRYIVNFIEATASNLPHSSGYEVFILMEFCPGGGIIDMLNTRLQNRLTEFEILKIFADTVEAVAYMHYQTPPLIHRDLKVENILLNPGPPQVYKLCDFGSARQPLEQAPASVPEIQALEAEINRTTTLQYRAPELVDVWRRGGMAEPVDIWALGVLLYKLCYYTTPFEEHGPLAILNVQYRFPSYPAYSSDIKALIGLMLQEHPGSRPNIYQVHERVCQLRGSPIKLANRYTVKGFSSGPAPARPTSRAPPPNDLTSILASGPGNSAPPPQSISDNIAPMRRGRPAASKAGPGPAHSTHTGPRDLSPPKVEARATRTGMATVRDGQRDERPSGEERRPSFKDSNRLGFDDSFGSSFDPKPVPSSKAVSSSSSGFGDSFTPTSSSVDKRRNDVSSASRGASPSGLFSDLLPPPTQNPTGRVSGKTSPSLTGWGLGASPTATMAPPKFALTGEADAPKELSRLVAGNNRDRDRTGNVAPAKPLNASEDPEFASRFPSLDEFGSSFEASPSKPSVSSTTSLSRTPSAPKSFATRPSPLKAESTATLISPMQSNDAQLRKDAVSRRTSPSRRPVSKENDEKGPPLPRRPPAGPRPTPGEDKPTTSVRSAISGGWPPKGSDQAAGSSATSLKPALPPKPRVDLLTDGDEGPPSFALKPQNTVGSSRAEAPSSTEAQTKSDRITKRMSMPLSKTEFSFDSARDRFRPVSKPSETATRPVQPQVKPPLKPKDHFKDLVPSGPAKPAQAPLASKSSHSDLANQLNGIQERWDTIREVDQNESSSSDEDDFVRRRYPSSSQYTSGDQWPPANSASPSNLDALEPPSTTMPYMSRSSTTLSMQTESDTSDGGIDLAPALASIAKFAPSADSQPPPRVESSPDSTTTDAPEEATLSIPVGHRQSRQRMSLHEPVPLSPAPKAAISSLVSRYESLSTPPPPTPTSPSATESSVTSDLNQIPSKPSKPSGLRANSLSTRTGQDTNANPAVVTVAKPREPFKPSKGATPVKPRPNPKPFPGEQEEEEETQPFKGVASLVSRWNNTIGASNASRESDDDKMKKVRQEYGEL